MLFCDDLSTANFDIFILYGIVKLTHRYAVLVECMQVRIYLNLPITITDNIDRTYTNDLLQGRFYFFISKRHKMLQGVIFCR